MAAALLLYLSVFSVVDQTCTRKLSTKICEKWVMSNGIIAMGKDEIITPSSCDKTVMETGRVFWLPTRIEVRRIDFLSVKESLAPKLQMKTPIAHHSRNAA